MKSVWFGIFGLMAAFAAVVAWYAYERAQTPEPASMQSSKTEKSTKQDKVAAVRKDGQEPAKPVPAQPPVKPEAKPLTRPSLPVAVKPEVTEKAAPEKTEPKKVAPPKVIAAEPVKPSFDVVRIEPDGSAVIAGRAGPGWRVKVQLQGKTIGEAVANKRGEWVVITESPVPYGSSNMQLSAISPDMLNTATSTQIVAISRPREPKLAALPAKPPAETKTRNGGDTAISAPSAAAGYSGSTDKPAAAIPPEIAKSMAETEKTMTKMAQSAKTVQKTPETAPGINRPEPATDKPGTAMAKAPAPASPEPKMPITRKTEKPAMAKISPAEEKPAITAKDTVSKSEQKPEMAPVKKPGPAKAAPAPPVGEGAEEPATTKTEPVKKADKAKIAEPETAPVKKAEPATVKTEKPAAETIAEKAEAKPLVVVSEPGKASKVLQSSGAPQAARPLSFRAVDYNDAGQVILSGKAEKGSSLRIYLNNDYIGNTIAGDNGEWVLTTKKHIDPGKYTLRVDQLGAANRIAARVEAPFERAAPAAVERARINGEVVIQPGDNLWNLSRAYYGSGVQYTVIYEANKNKIRDPDFIYPGQIFTTPDSDPASREAEREALRQKMLRRR